MLRRVLLLGQLPLLAAGAAAAQALDSAQLVRVAVRAESRYEMSIRRYAPASFGASHRRDCDEVVGRYCVYYSADRDTLPSEPPQVGLARDSAIAALRAALPVAPPRLVHSLVRLLVDDGRASEAVEVARAYARVESGADGHMLLGFALHADRRTTEAAEQFGRWIDLLPQRDRDRIADLRWLLADAERKRYQRLTPAERTAYEGRAWRFADPLYLTPGNELWTDHLARQAVSRMFGLRGHALGASWGGDLEQLTVRFGTPVRTTKSWQRGSMGMSDEYSDHWDPAQRTYLPPSLREALAAPERLDTVWPLDTVTSRSGHAPPTLRVMKALEGQVVAFRNELRVTAVAWADTPVTKPAAAVFLLDSALHIVAEAALDPAVTDDSIVLRGALPLHDAAHFYSLEVYDAASRFGARKRYQIRRPATTRLSLSNILLAEPFAAGRLPEHRDSPLLAPLTRPVVVAGAPLGLYAEVQSTDRRRQSVEVGIEVRSMSRGSAVTRAAGWIGERLGLSSRRAPTRLGWVVELEPDRPTALPLTVDLGQLDAGRYRVTLEIRDGQGRDRVVSERDFLVVTSRSSNSRRP